MKKGEIVPFSGSTILSWINFWGAGHNGLIILKMKPLNIIHERSSKKFMDMTQKKQTKKK
jgi:hypothetical protein